MGKINTICNLRENQVFKQKLRVPITLKEFMPKELFNFDVVSCYTTQVDDIEEQKDDTHKSLYEITHVPTGNEDVDITNITFTSEDLLLRSTLHNHPLFVIGYCEDL